jgi:hypothetical protein
MNGRNRDRVEKELSRRGIDPAKETTFVDHILDLFGIDDDEDFDDRDIKDLVDDAEEHWKTYQLGQEQMEPGTRWDSLTKGGTVPSMPVRDAGKKRMEEGKGNEFATLGSSVGIRIGAFSEYLAKIIATDPGVMRFRERFLGGPTNTLSFEQAQRFIDSPATRFLPYGFFKQRGIPFTEHDAVLENYEEVREDGTRYHRATVSIDLPGIAETVRSGDVEEGAIQSLWWPRDDDSEYAQHVRVWESSVLGELQRLASQLARKHPWQEDQAALFVLTGITPLASTLRGGARHSYGNGVAAHKYDSTIIELEAQAWVPVEEVAKAYRKLQREAHGGHNYRSPEDRNVEVFRFVLEQSEVQILNREEHLAKLTLPKWKEMRQAWNEMYARGHKWHYYNSKDPDARIFRRDFDRGQQAVIGTKCGLPGIPNQPMTKAEAVERARAIIRERRKWRTV